MPPTSPAPPPSPVDETPGSVAPLPGAAMDFEELLRRYEGRVYNLCYYMLGNADDAADAAQDALVRAWKAWPRFRGASQPGTWLHRIAVNVALDYSSRRGKTPTAFTNLGGEDDLSPETTLPATDPGPEAVAMSTERREVLYQALGQLNPEQRMVVVLYDLQGYAYEELAALLELPLGTVKSRLNRARLALHRLLLPHRELFLD